MAKALRESNLHQTTTEYIISDDASTEFDKKYLEKQFPHATVIRHNKKFAKPDMNTHFCIEYFLDGEYDILVILDSDMIVSANWHERLSALIHTDGFKIGSLYNSTMHPIRKTYNGVTVEPSSRQCDGYTIKSSIGFAGMVMTRELAMELRENALKLGGTVYNDWDICILKGPIFHCIQPSALAHIGVVGQWNNCHYYSSGMDRAVDFDWKSVSSSVKIDCERIVGTKLKHDT